MDATFFTSGEAAETLGIPRSRFLYLVERGDLPALGIQYQQLF
jgi:hypothetical protein